MTKTIPDDLHAQVAALSAAVAALAPAPAPAAAPETTPVVDTKSAPAPEVPAMTPDEIKALVAETTRSAAEQAVAGYKATLSASREGRHTPFDTSTVDAGASGPTYLKETSDLSRATNADWLVALGRKALGRGSMDYVESIRYALDQKALADGTLAATPNFTGSNSSGAALAPIEFSKTIVDYLYPLVAVRRAGTQVYDMQMAELVLPRLLPQSGAALPVNPVVTSEATAFTTSQPLIKQIVLKPQLIGSMVVVSRQLVMDSEPAVEQVLRDAIVRAMSVYEDYEFLVGTGTNQLKGLFTYTVAGDGIVGNTPAANGAYPIYDDFMNAITALQANNVPLNKGCWFMHPNLYGYIRRLKDTQGRPIFTDFIGRTVTGDVNLTATALYGGGAPTLFGLPVYLSQQIPVNQTRGTGTNLTSFILADMDYVKIGQRGGLEMDASTDAAYTDNYGGGSTLASSFQNNQIVYRAMERVDITVTIPTAVYLGSGFSYL